MQLIITLVIVFMVIGLFIGYVVLAIFFPEWVGIAGKRAKEIEDRHDPSKFPEVENIKDI